MELLESDVLAFNAVIRRRLRSYEWREFAKPVFDAHGELIRSNAERAKILYAEPNRRSEAARNERSQRDEDFATLRRAVDEKREARLSSLAARTAAMEEMLRALEKR